MQTQINWIKYEGRPQELEGGLYLVHGFCIREGKGLREIRVAELIPYPSGKLWKKGEKWLDLGSFIIEYIAPLREIERGIEEGVNKQK